MPYKVLSDLPSIVRTHLPVHAQKIYRAALNNAWDEHADPDARRSGASREETAHKIAWSAVKQTYVKKGDRWVKKDQNHPS